MGMSASQMTLLTLTARNHDIGLQLEHLSNDKQALTRRMQEISKAYNTALSKKTLKLSNNAGVSYTDLNYSAFMRPSAFNQNKPYLITNTNGKIVLDDKYAKFASMISADGNAGGDYESNRIKILSQLTGIPESKLESLDTAIDTSNEAGKNLETARNATTAARKNAFKTINDDEFLKMWGKAGDIDFSKTKFGNFGMVEIGSDINSARKTLSKIATDIVKNMSPYIEDSNIDAFTNALTNICNEAVGYIEGVKDGSSTGTVEVTEASAKFVNWKYVTEDGSVKIDIDDFIGKIFGAIAQECSNSGSNLAFMESDGDYKFEVITNGKSSSTYQKYLTAKANETAEEEKYKNAINSENSIFTAEEETQIDFYDLLFNAIAEKGWVEDCQVTDNDYLNNMMQNNLYTITTIEENTNYDADEQYDSYKKNKFNYSTDIASNFNKVFYVNDEDARQEALTNYEYEKSVVNAKESRIDTRMKNLETEQSAINQMIKGIEQVEKDNIETFFSIFS